jgi:hypothetical protein
MAIIIKRTIFAMIVLWFTAGLGGCGGSSSSDASSSDDQYETYPVDVSLRDVQLIAGMPTTITYTIPAATSPYNQITIELNRTLQEANLSVTPTP